MAEEERQLDIFKRRLRAMEENGTISYYEILFDAKSFSDFLSRRQRNETSSRMNM